MKDRRKAGDRKREVIEGADPAPRKLPRRRAALLFAAGVALGAVAVYAVVHFAPADEPQPAKSELTSEPPVTPQPAAPRQPTVILASLALPATAEQLQQETRQVATALRTRYPDRAEALHVAAMMHVQLRQSGEAEKLWKECIELSPKKEQYYVNLAAVAMDRGNSELAAETLQGALDAGLSSADVLHHLGVALTNLGRSDEAVQVLKRALVDNPQLASHWMVLGQAQLKLGQPAEAEASLKQAIGMGLQSSAAYAALANACAQQEKQDEAAKYREILAKLTAGRPMAAQERFRILSTDEARRAAVAILTEAATVHSWQGNSLEAERLLLRAIALDPASAASCRALATIYRDAKMTAEEQVVWRRLIELEPYNFDNYLNLATSCQQLDQPEAAEAALKMALTVLPDAAGAYTTLANFYLQSGKTRQARWYAQEALRREPTTDGYVLLASICRLLGNAADARHAMDEARKLGHQD